MFWVAIVLEGATLRASFGTDYDRYVAGWRAHPSREFSLEQALRNGEHRAVLGFAGALAVLGLKVWFSMRSLCIIVASSATGTAYRGGAVSSGVEHRFYTPAVTGSNPVPPTSLRPLLALGLRLAGQHRRESCPTSPCAVQ